MNQNPNEHLPQEPETDAAELQTSPDSVEEMATEPPKSPEKQKKKGPNRKLRMGATATILTVVVIVGVVLLNVVMGILNDRYPLKLDLTSDKNFTLSDESVEVAKAVKEDMQIVVFQEETNLTKPGWGSDSLNLVIRQFYEALKQYSNYSGGKITLEFFDPNTNPVKAAKYKDYEVTDQSILFLCGKRNSVITLFDLFTYDDTSLYYSGQYVVTESHVEKVLATNVRRVAGELDPVILFTGHGEDKAAIANVTDTLELNGYEVVQHDLTAAGEITEEATTAVLAAPSKDFGDAEILKLREWLQNDGLYTRHLVLMAHYAADCPNLYEFLEEEYGIEVTRDIIVETKNYYTAGTNAYGMIGASDYTSSLAEKKALLINTRRLVLHQDSDTTKSLYNIPLVTFEKTAKLLDIDAETIDETRDADSYPIVGMAYAHKQLDASTANITVDSTLLVCGSQATLDSNVRKYITNAENEALFMGVFNGMTGSEDNIMVSSKPVNQSTITYESGTQQWIGLGLFTIALPLAALLIGLIVFLRRRHL